MAISLRWVSGVGVCASFVLLACSAENTAPQRTNNGGQGGASGAGPGGAFGAGGSVGGAGPGGAGPGGAGPGGAGGAGGSVGGAGPGGAGPGGAGGTDPTGGTGGTDPTGGTGGTDPTGGTGGSVGGVGGGGTGGVGGGTSFPECDGRNQSPTNPVRGPCGSYITSYPVGTGTKIQLGPYGARTDGNVGKGFENPNPMDDASCVGFAAAFGENPELTQKLLNTGTQPCTASEPNTGNCLNYSLYTVYYPAQWPEGPIPVLAWGNGTCAQPEGYGALLRYIASYGFFVIAPNSRQAGSGATLRKALDYAAAANMTGPYAGHLDLSKMGVMGHSQGGGAATGASSDARVKSAIIYNASPRASKPFYAASGEFDIGITLASMQSAINGATKAAYTFHYNPAGQGALRGHLVLMQQPQRLTEQSVAWWQATLNNDMTARNKFVGATCAFCGKNAGCPGALPGCDYAFGQKGM